MSFSSKIKSELASVKLDRKSAGAEFCGMVFMCGTLSFGRGGLSLMLSTEHKSVVTRAVSLICELFNITPEISQKIELKAKETYIITIPASENVSIILNSCALEFNAGIRLDEERLKIITGSSRSRAAFLRGAFLGSGSVADPNKIYHLEFVASMQEFAACVLNILKTEGFKAGILERRGSFVVYMKDIDNISDFLALTGAHSGVLELENVRILKDIRNNVNRQINCENANIDKTVRSALQQINDIRALSDSGKIEKLSPALREAAEIRLQYPEASLSELSEMLGISRSGLYHRLKKLAQYAREAGGKTI